MTSITNVFLTDGTNDYYYSKAINYNIPIESTRDRPQFGQEQNFKLVGKELQNRFFLWRELLKKLEHEINHKLVIGEAIRVREFIVNWILKYYIIFYMIILNYFPINQECTIRLWVRNSRKLIFRSNSKRNDFIFKWSLVHLNFNPGYHVEFSYLVISVT